MIIIFSYESLSLLGIFPAGWSAAESQWHLFKYVHFISFLSLSRPACLPACHRRPKKILFFFFYQTRSSASQQTNINTHTQTERRTFSSSSSSGMRRVKLTLTSPSYRSSLLPTAAAALFSILLLLPPPLASYQRRERGRKYTHTHTQNLHNPTCMQCISLARLPTNPFLVHPEERSEKAFADVSAFFSLVARQTKQNATNASAERKEQGHSLTHRPPL